MSLSKSCFSASDWLKRCFNQSQALLTCHQCGISAVVSQTSFVVKPVITSCNVASFLKLSNMLSCCEHICVTSWSVFFLQLNNLLSKYLLLSILFWFQVKDLKNKNHVRSASMSASMFWWNYIYILIIFISFNIIISLYNLLLYILRRVYK